MAKRLLDIIFSFIALIILSPIFLIAAIGIKMSSNGPIIYKTKRVGFNEKEITVYKFRTMHVNHGGFDSTITAQEDPRIFKFGKWLRILKIDELPQLINIIKGDMSIVGPRPEDPEIVKNYYSDEYIKTLSVRPGLASPGSIFNYTHGDEFIGNECPEEDYVENFLPIKLTMELIYVNNRNLFYDLRIIFRTLYVILSKSFGKENFKKPVEYKKAKEILN
jgi:lipopolysaccharide/colanic/teichoic acid biosynthesis glycosyltransferase